MFVTRLLGPKAHWEVRSTTVGDLVRLEMTQVHLIDPKHQGAVQLTREVIGPLWLRRAVTFQRSNPFAESGVEAYLQRVVGDDWVANVFVHMPGTVATDQVGTGGTADGSWCTWRLKVSDLAQRPERWKEIKVGSRSWRRSVLVVLLAVLAMVLYVAWPLIVPPADIRAARAARRAERRAARRAAAEKRAVAKAEAAERARAAKAAAAAKAIEEAARAADEVCADDATAESVAAVEAEQAPTEGAAGPAVEPPAAEAATTPPAEPGLRRRRRAFWWPRRRR